MERRKLKSGGTVVKEENKETRCAAPSRKMKFCRNSRWAKLLVGVMKTDGGGGLGEDDILQNSYVTSECILLFVPQINSTRTIFKHVADVLTFEISI